MDFPTQTEEFQRVETLLGELEAARKALFDANLPLATAWKSFSHARLTLNEPQFTKRLEAAAGDQVKANEVIASQKQRRIAYKCGQVAMGFALRRLYQNRDQFSRTAMKVVDAVPHIEDAEMRRWLISRCVIEMRHAVSISGPMLAQFTKEAAINPMVRDYSDVVAAAVKQWREQEWQCESALIATDGKSMRNICVYQNNKKEHFGSYQLAADAGLPKNMFLISLSGCGLRSEYIDLIERLIEKANLLTEHRGMMEFGQWPGELAIAQKDYQDIKAALNEPQYSQRLQDAVVSGDQGKVQALRDAQQHKRFALLNARLVLTRRNSLVQMVARELLALTHELATAFEQDANIYGHSEALHANIKMAVMNNILAAHQMVSDVYQYTGKWQEEFDTSEHIENAADDILHGALAACVALPDYTNLRWSYSHEGKIYTSPRELSAFGIFGDGTQFND